MQQTQLHKESYYKITLLDYRSLLLEHFSSEVTLLKLDFLEHFHLLPNTNSSPPFQASKSKNPTLKIPFESRALLGKSQKQTQRHFKLGLSISETLTVFICSIKTVEVRALQTQHTHTSMW